MWSFGPYFMRVLVIVIRIYPILVQRIKKNLATLLEGRTETEELELWGQFRISYSLPTFANKLWTENFQQDSWKKKLKTLG
jgi:hypothetical protein